MSDSFFFTSTCLNFFTASITSSGPLWWLRVDTVRAGPVPVRAAVWTGRRWSGPDRTELCSGPDYRDRTGWHEARCGPAVLAVLTTSSHCHVGPGHRSGGRSSSTVARAGEEAPDARRRERKAREREREQHGARQRRGGARGRRREVEAQRREVVPGRGSRGRWRRRGGRGAARARKRMQWQFARSRTPLLLALLGWALLISFIGLGLRSSEPDRALTGPDRPNFGLVFTDRTGHII